MLIDLISAVSREMQVGENAFDVRSGHSVSLPSSSTHLDTDQCMEIAFGTLFRKNLIIANPQEYNCSAWKLPGSEGTHGQTSEHRQ